MGKRHSMSLRGGMVLACVMLVAVAASAQLPDGIATRGVEFWSDGTLLAGDLFWPESLNDGERLPAIVMCGGWGSLKKHANATAPYYAAQGYFVLTFDYRGWGESDGRLVAVGEIPELGADGTATLKVREIRDLVSPVERIEDIRAAISWLELEPGVDSKRIGLWGTSFGGGNVVAVAALDKRVKTVCSQVGDVNTRHGWMTAMKMLVSMYPKAKGTPEELADQYIEVVRLLSEQAGQAEILLREEKIAQDAWGNPMPQGLLLVTEKGASDPAVKAFVEENNALMKKFYSILATDPDRAAESITIIRAQRARGLIDPFPQGKGMGTVPPMTGIADAVQMMEYSAMDHAALVSCPVQIIEAGKEELMDIENVGGALYKALDGQVPVERHILDCTHFEIYRPPFLQEAIKLQIAWFNKYLKGESAVSSNAAAAIQQAIDGMTAAFAAGNVDAYIAYFSDEFTSFHHFDKAGFREFLAQSWQEMEWKTTWNMSTLKIDGDTATATFTSSSGMGTFPVPTTFKKEADGVWRIVSQG